LGWICGIISLQLYSKESLIKRFIVKTLLLLYLLSGYLHAVHIHSSHEAHGQECKVCVVAKTFQSADVPPVPFAVASLSILHVEERGSYPAVVFPLEKGYFSTAPPFV
jgi:hypothetical protein